MRVYCLSLSYARKSYIYNKTSLIFIKTRCNFIILQRWRVIVIFNFVFYGSRFDAIQVLLYYTGHTLLSKCKPSKLIC